MTVGYPRAEPPPTPSTPTDHNTPPGSPSQPPNKPTAAGRLGGRVRRAVQRLRDILKTTGEAVWSGCSGAPPEGGGLLHAHPRAQTRARGCIPPLYYCGVVQGLFNASSIKPTSEPAPRLLRAF